jgi:hypothetical protein|tara:strand:+ start:131 stop:307 length:177 start_codon:yes stop_codon:yes gene_type:complete
MSEVVWSVNIMVAILLVAVGYVIYWVFKYDEWYPNDNVHSHISNESQCVDSGDENVEV